MRLFIGGSVSNEIDDKYKNEEEKLAEAVIKNKWDIICCGDLRGIFGNLYHEWKKSKFDMKMAVPKVYLPYAKDLEKEINYIPNTINERTDILIKEADVCVFLPGGIGTIYEIMSTIETKRAGEHNKEIVIINFDGFFNKLLEMLEQIYKEKFANNKDRDNYIIVNTTEEAIQYLKNKNN